VCGDEGVVSGWEGLIWDMLDTAKMFNLTRFEEKE